jgi:hypothetical protein
MINRVVIVGAGCCVLGAIGCAGSSQRPAASPPTAATPTTGGTTGTTTGTTTSAPTGVTTGTTAGCPGGNGIYISTTSGPLTDTASGVNTVISLDQSVDTTLVFDISRKTWTLTDLAASISVGLADESRGRYAICAGVTALMPSATLTISGARGRVHFAASLKELTDALRLRRVQ